MFRIFSPVKGVSSKSYETHEIALAVARDAWRADNDGVGICQIVTCQCACNGCNGYECCETSTFVCTWVNSEGHPVMTDFIDSILNSSSPN